MFAKGVVNLRKGLLVCLAILMQAWFAAPAHAQAAPTISAISTNRSSTNGGTTVVITGTNFTGATRVYWSGNFNVDMASYTVDSATQITAVTAASGFSGNGAIAVQTPNGTATIFGFEVLPAPTISSVSPPSGPAAGGTTVFINGQGFADIFSNSVITAVKFGGVNAASFQLQGSTLVAVTAPGTPGQADVQVTTSVGDTATLANSFSYLAPLPTISSVSPSAGPTSGGTSVVITGTNFIGVSQVNFGLLGGGSTPAQSFTVNSATQITAVSPQVGGNAYNATIEVRTASGSVTQTNAFAYTPPPQISSVNPSTGDIGGGTSVTIIGNNFVQGQTTVSFGGIAATSVTVNSTSSLTAVTGPRTAGTVDVIVTTPGGSVTRSSGYTYAVVPPAPTITSVSPSSGPNTGGTLVTVNGTNFVGVQSVGFGLIGPMPVSYTVVSPTQITFTTPSTGGSTGSAFLSIQTAGGVVNLPSAFTYTAAPAVPVISFVSGATGPEAGGTRVSLNGSNFAGTTSVTFGGVAALSFSATSNSIVAYAPPGTGSVPIVVTNAVGSATASTQFVYTAATAPSIFGLSSSSPPPTGATVAVYGSNLETATSVTIAGTATTFSVVQASATSFRLEVAVPAGTVNTTVPLVVTTPSGTASTNLTYMTASGGAPSISSVSPQSVSTAGGMYVTINGTNIGNATAVSIGGVAAPAFFQQGVSTLVVKVPAGSAGAVPVSVTTPAGTVTQQNALTYVVSPVPVISSVTPNFGPASGGTSVILRGSGFTGATSVSVQGAPATFTVDSDTQISAVTGAAASGGAASFVVVTPGGQATAPFTYQLAGFAAPTVSSISTASGPTTGGTNVVISGTNFVSSATVTFGGVAARFVVNSATQITATAPAGSAGVVGIGVTTPGGTATLSSAYTYAAPGGAAPTISGVAPNSGPVAGGTSVVITGTDLTGATAVSFGGTAATSFTVDSATQITAVAPAGSAGAVGIAVTTAAGTVTSSNAYTYVATQQAAPTIASIAPNSGPVAGGTSVVITGTNLTGASAVTFGGTAATSFTVDSATQITAVAPAGTAGAASVAVTTAGGTAALAGGFTYVTPGTITAVAPNSGPIAGGTSVVITGTNLTGASAVTFGGTAATSFTVDSATQITAVAPAGSAGAVGIAVTTAAGTVTSSNAYTYVAMQQAPTIASIAPNSGPVAGGTSVVITGTNLTGASAVTFGGTAATSFTVNSATQITAVAPAGTAGAANIAVTTAGGTVTLAGGFTYAGAPVISTPGNAAGATTAALALDENQTAIARLTANETVTWSVDGGSDAASFRIDPATGALVFVNATDFENPTDSDRNNGYVVRVKAVDLAGNASYQTVTVTVLNVDEIGRKLAQISDKLRTGLLGHAAHSLSDMLSFNEALMRTGYDDCANPKAKKLSGAANANQNGGQVKLDYTKRLSECGRRNQVFTDLGLTYSKQGGNWNTRMFASLRFEHQLTADLTLGAGLLVSRASDSLTGFANSAISDQSLQGTVYGRYRISQRLRTGGFAGYGEGWYDFSLADSDGFLLDGKMTGKRQVYGWMLGGDFNIGQTVITTDAVVSHAREKLGSATLAASYLGESRSGIGFAVGSVDTTRISVPLTAPIQLSGNEELGRSTRLLLSPGLLCEDNNVQTSALRCGYQVGAKFVVKDGGRNRLYADYRWESVAGLRRALFGLGYAYRFGEKEALELAFEANSGATSMHGQDNRAMVAVRVAH